MTRHDSHFFIVSHIPGVDWQCNNCQCGWHDAASTKPCPPVQQIAEEKSADSIDWFAINASVD